MGDFRSLRSDFNLYYSIYSTKGQDLTFAVALIDFLTNLFKPQPQRLLAPNLKPSPRINIHPLGSYTSPCPPQHPKQSTPITPPSRAPTPKQTPPTFKKSPNHSATPPKISPASPQARTLASAVATPSPSQASSLAKQSSTWAQAADSMSSKLRVKLGQAASQSASIQARICLLSLGRMLRSLTPQMLSSS